MRDVSIESWRQHVHDEDCPRDCTWTSPMPLAVGDSWQEIAQGQGSELVGFSVAEFEVAEEVIGMLIYSNGFVEVGIGEALRPYQRLYYGTDAKDAEDRFWQTVTLHVRNM